MSGKEVIMKRVHGQSKTWMNQFPKVNVYSDEFKEDETDAIRKAARYTNVSFITIKNTSEHLLGTQWKNPWYAAQTRFLPAMKHLFETNRNAKWFLFGDDDTYLVAKNIVRRTHKYNHNEPCIVSYFYCAWNNIVQYMEPKRDCMPFAQGGSGVLISNKLMSMIAPHLVECSEMYNDAEHAASMRIAVCIQKLYGVSNWTKGAFIKPWRSGFHSHVPDIEIEQGNTWDAPGSFHQVNKEVMQRIHKAHVCDTEEDFYYDFAYNAFISVPVELTYGTKWELHFGYCIDMYGSHSHRINATSAIVCDVPDAEFHQDFQNNVTVTMHCDSNMNEGDMYADDVERSPFGTIVHLNMKCPTKSYYGMFE